MDTQGLLLTIAASLYTAYSDGVGGKAFNGDPLPTAEEFFADQSKKKQQNGWIEAAKVALDMVAEEFFADQSKKKQQNGWIEAAKVDLDMVAENTDTETESDTAPNTKTLHNSDVSGARENVKDIKVVGNGDTFQLICKASSESEGWMKSTKAMQIGDGVVVQVTTQQGDQVAEAICHVPRCKIVKDSSNGRKLVAH